MYGNFSYEFISFGPFPHGGPGLALVGLGCEAPQSSCRKRGDGRTLRGAKCPVPGTSPGPSCEGLEWQKLPGFEQVVTWLVCGAAGLGGVAPSQAR